MHVTVGGSLLLYTTLSLPFVQRWLGRVASDILSDELECDVRIARVDATALGRLVLDTVTVFDQQRDTMIAATRLSARIGLTDLLAGEIKIGHVQLYKADIRLSGDSTNRLNCQYLIDKFTTEKSNGKGTDFSINNILIRRSKVRYSRENTTYSIHDLGVTVYSLHIRKKVFSCILHDMHLDSDWLRISGIHAVVTAGPDGGSVTDAHITTPNSKFGIKTLTWSQGFGEWQMHTTPDSHISTLDVPRKLLNGNTQLAEILSVIPTLNIKLWASGTDTLATIEELDLADHSRRLALTVQGTIRTDTLQADIKELQLDVDRRLVSRIAQHSTFFSAPNESAAFDTPVQLRASGSYRAEGSWAHATLTVLGATIGTEGSLHENDRWEIKAAAQDVDITHLLSQFAATLPFAKQISDKEGRVDFDITASGSLRNDSKNVSGNVACNSNPLTCNVTADLSQSSFAGTRIKASADVLHATPSALGAKGRLAQHTYTAKASIDMGWEARESYEEATGRIRIDDLRVLNDSLYTSPLVRQLLLDIWPTGDGAREINLMSDFANAHGMARGKVSKLVHSATAQLHKAIPLKSTVMRNDLDRDDNLKGRAHVFGTTLMSFLAGTEIAIDDTLALEIKADSTTFITASCRNMAVGSERLSDIALMGNIEPGFANIDVTLGRATKNRTVTINGHAECASDSLLAGLRWHFADERGMESPTNRGLVRASLLMGDTTQIHILPGSVTLNSAAWQIQPSTIRLLPGGAMRIDHFAAECGHRHLRLNGRLSANTTDTLRAELCDVNLGYIFDIVNFHDVELNGDASGLVNVTGVTSKPTASGHLNVKEFTFNDAVLGALDLDAAWSTTSKQLTLDGRIVGEGVTPQTKLGITVPSRTHITGYVRPGRSNPNNGLDLRIEAGGFNMGFLNEWTEGIAKNLSGALSGHARIHGPLKAIELEGKVKIDHCRAHIPALNVDFQFAGDSVIMVPGAIRFHHLRLHDQMGGLDAHGHKAELSGALTHRHFKNWKYDFTAVTDNLLGYDVREFGGETFHATAFLSGNVHMHGGPGQLSVDVTGTTMPGTELVYNSSGPSGLVTSDFITYVNQEYYLKAHGTTDTRSQFDPGSDLRLNFDLDVTPDAQLRVLMDTRNSDFIELRGRGNLKADYYNKGAFTMRGLYNVERGRYRMTINGPIRKDFTLSEGSMISFTGNPMQSQLNLQAVYPVSGVHLNDLAIGNPFSSSAVKVNCLLNLTGTVSAPQVSFDFDLPGASQDEKAMVKSLVSTEEERNLQAIYLLSLNTFYAQDKSEGQNRGTGAVNSFISSTLSNQLNNVLTNAMGKSNWTFGTNISTSQAGWREMQAEGSVSGRLFRDRLFVNGTFGYREGGTTTTTGFVGDFDIQWRLTPGGTVNLKAYSQTTDRYFTKSALTTQGLGLLLKKDFDSLRELLNIKKKKKESEKELR